MSASVRSTTPRRPIPWFTLAVVTGFWLFITVGYRHVDRFFEDAFLRFWVGFASRATKADVVIVKLTDAALANRARVPLPRDILSKIVEETVKTRPRAIVLNHPIERDRTMRDTQLYASLTNAGNAYIAQDFRTGPRGLVIPESFTDPFLRLTNRIAPVFFKTDDEGVVRSVPLKYSDATGDDRPTLPALLAGYTSSMTDFPESIPLRFRARADDLFSSVNAEGLIQWTNTGALPDLASLVNTNTTVIIGPFYQGARKQWAASGAVAGPDGIVASTHLLAYALDTLSRQPWPHRMPVGIEVFLSLLFIFTGYFCSAGGNRRRGMGAVVGLSAVYLAASFISARWGCVWPVALVLAGCLLGLFLGRIHSAGGINPSASSHADRRKDRPAQKGSAPRPR